MGESASDMGVREYFGVFRARIDALRMVARTDNGGEDRVGLADSCDAIGSGRFGRLGTANSRG